MGALRSVPIDEIVRSGNIRDIDVLRLRTVIHSDGLVSDDEAEALLLINAVCSAQDPRWSELFIEGITDYLVYQSEPEGYVTAEGAKWLLDNVAPEGAITHKNELDLIINILDKARWSPVSLACFALGEIRRAVVDGVGPLRCGDVPDKGWISDEEVEQVRKILYAFGGDGNVAVTRAEADVLFDINDAIIDPQACPLWTDLFVKAVANVVMAVSGQAVPPRDEALRHVAWFKQRGDLSPRSLFAAMVTASLDAVWNAYRDQSPEERALARLEQQRIEIITNEEITQAEAAWLSARLARDGRLGPSEAALIAYLNRESPNIHPDLQATVERLARAA